MILDARGNPIDPRPRPHRFGHFVVPPDAHIKGFSAFAGDAEPSQARISSDDAQRTPKEQRS